MTRNSAALTILAVFAQTRTQHNGTDECKHTTHAVYNSRTSEIVEHVTESGHHKAIGSIVAEPTTTPSPVTFNRIDDKRDDCAVNQIHRELSAFSHRTAHNRSRCGAEHCLKNQETLYRKVAYIEREVAPVGHTNKSSKNVTAKHQAETDEEEQKRAEHEIDKVLHQDVSCILSPCESCLAQGKSRLHPKD